MQRFALIYIPAVCIRDSVEQFSCFRGQRDFGWSFIDSDQGEIKRIWLVTNRDGQN